MLFLESGIHPTIAGVLVAFTVPARPVVKLDDFTCEMTGYLDMLDYTEVRHSRKAAVLSSTQIQVLNNIHSLADKTISPLQSIANKLHPLVNYLILPLFAFVNAGVTFGDIGIGSLLGIPLAVFFGLFAGKSLGIFLFTYIFVRFASCYDAGRGEQTEPIRGVDVGRYRFYGSSLYSRTCLLPGCLMSE